MGRQTPEKDFPDVPWCVAVVGEQGQDQVIVTTTIAILTLISSLLILNQLMILNATVVQLLLNQNAFYFSHLIPKTTVILFIFPRTTPTPRNGLPVQHDTCSVLLLHTCDPWCYMIHAHSYLIVTENCIWQFWRQMESFLTS